MNIANLSNLYPGNSISAGGIDAMSGASGYVPAADDQLAAMRADIKQRSQDFKDLRAALSSGNLANAQKAFGVLSQDIQKASTSAGQSLFDPNSPIGKDFQSISKALQDGDLSSAKQAFQAFTHDIRNAHRLRSQAASNDGDSDDGVSVTQAAATDLTQSVDLSLGLNTMA
jgi:hypothetical protein